MSLFAVKTERAIVAAENALEAVKKYRAKELETAIEKEMSGWFFPSKTRESAISYLKSGKFYKLEKWHSGMWMIEAAAKNLLAALKATKADMVFLSNNDAGLVSEYENWRIENGQEKDEEETRGYIDI